MLNIEDLKAKLAALNLLPWDDDVDGHISDDKGEWLFCDVFHRNAERHANAIGIVALVNAASELIAEIERLRKVETAARVVADLRWGLAVSITEANARIDKMEALREALKEPTA